MKLEINIKEDDIDNFSPDAKHELVRQLTKIGNNIIKESNLIEEAIREHGAKTEITSNIVIKAARKSDRNVNKKKNKMMIFFKICSALSSLITGLLFDIDGYENKSHILVVFIIFFAIACVTTVLDFVYEYKE